MDKAENFKGKVHFGVITIKSEEYQAFLAHLPDPFIVDGEDERYRVAQLSCSDGSEILVAVTRCIGQGNIEAQKVASDLVQDLAPQWVLVVGIAGGVPSPDFSLGDVVVSSLVHDFTLESSKPGGEREYSVKGDSIHSRAKRVVQDVPGMLASELADWHSKVGMDRPKLDLEDLDGHLGGDDEWRRSIKESLIRHFSVSRSPIVLSGAIASSDRLVKDPEIAEDWKKVARHYVAIEMELAGVCHAIVGLPVLGIRGISDIVGFKRDEVWTAYACKTAAAFAIALIRSGLMPLSRIGPDLQITSGNSEFRNIGQSYNTSRIRKLLNDAFDDASLDFFCKDNFPDVYNCFGSGTGKDVKINLLLAHCRHSRNGFGELLGTVQEINEYLFVKNRPYLVSDDQLVSGVVVTTDLADLMAELTEWKGIHNESQALVKRLDTPLSYLTAYRFSSNLEKLEDAHYTWQTDCAPELRLIPDKWNLSYAYTPELDRLRKHILDLDRVMQQLVGVDIAKSEFMNLYIQFGGLKNTLWSVLTAADKRIMKLVEVLNFSIENRML